MRFFFFLAILGGLCSGAYAQEAAPLTAQNARPQDARQFIYYVSFGRADDVRLLLSQGADPKTKNDLGWPLLSVAAARRDPESLKIVQALAEAGADVNEADANKNYPLLNAVKNSNAPVVAYLLAKGARFDIITKESSSLRDVAARAGDRQVLAMIDEAIRVENERIRYEKSEVNRARLIKEFAFGNCAYQYLDYYLESKQEKDAAVLATASDKLRLTREKLGASIADLYRLFGITQEHLKEIGDSSRLAIYAELESMISNRNRRAKGIGRESDLTQRCGKVAAPWSAGDLRIDPSRPPMPPQ